MAGSKTLVETPKESNVHRTRELGANSRLCTELDILQNRGRWCSGAGKLRPPDTVHTKLLQPMKDVKRTDQWNYGSTVNGSRTCHNSQESNTLSIHYKQGPAF